MGELIETNWRDHGVQIVRGAELDPNTPQSAGMARAASITQANINARKLWAGTGTIQPGAKTGAHHDGSLDF